MVMLVFPQSKLNYRIIFTYKVLLTDGIRRSTTSALFTEVKIEERHNVYSSISGFIRYKLIMNIYRVYKMCTGLIDLL